MDNHTQGQGAYDSDSTDIFLLATQANAFVLGTLVYHDPFSGILINTLNYLHANQILNKPVALISNGRERATRQPSDQLRIVAKSLSAIVIPTQVVTSDADFGFLGRQIYVIFAVAIVTYIGRRDMNFHICFTCPDRFCELLPGDLGSSAIFLHDLVSQALVSFPQESVVIAVELDFDISESTYLVHIHIRSNAHLGAITYDRDTLRLEIECIISQVMLQCFWEVRYAECRDCPG